MYDNTIAAMSETDRTTGTILPNRILFSIPVKILHFFLKVIHKKTSKLHSDRFQGTASIVFLFQFGGNDLHFTGYFSELIAKSLDFAFKIAQHRVTALRA